MSINLDENTNEEVYDLYNQVVDNLKYLEEKEIKEDEDIKE